MTDEKKTEGKAAGGYARAAKLSAEERSEIAANAARERWAPLPEAMKNLPRVLSNYAAILDLRGVKLPCAVIEGRGDTEVRRVLSEHGITRAILGGRSGASKRLKSAAPDNRAPMPLFLAPPRLKPFISQDLIDGPLKPIDYVHGKRVVKGYEASILVDVCNVWLQAREAGELQGQQLGKAQKAEILLRALAKTGIDALIDDVTGYQEIRDRLALQAILDKYLTDEFSKWTKKFPDEYYKEVFRLKGLSYPSIGTQRPQWIGHVTNSIIYSRLAPGVLKVLKKKNPRSPKGHRPRKFFQHLTRDFGIPELRDCLQKVITVMKTCDDSDWEDFEYRLSRALPKYGDTMTMPTAKPKPPPG